jgi:hypothetical protein
MSTDSPGTFFETGTVTAIEGATVTLARGQETTQVSFEGCQDELVQVEVGQEIAVKVRRVHDVLSALRLDRGEFE